MKKKIHGNQFYPLELIEKAVKTYKTGKHSLKDVCEEYGIKSTTTLRYHLGPRTRTKLKESLKKWRAKQL